jgi:hypothetical protein
LTSLFRNFKKQTSIDLLGAQFGRPDEGICVIWKRPIDFHRAEFRPPDARKIDFATACLERVSGFAGASVTKQVRKSGRFQTSDITSKEIPCALDEVS